MTEMSKVTHEAAIVGDNLGNADLELQRMEEILHYLRHLKPWKARCGVVYFCDSEVHCVAFEVLGVLL